ncbi:MAG: polyphenol oxidase family protein [Acidimicrobiales bacterium]
MLERLLPAGPCHQVRVRCSQRADGDFHVDLPADELAARRQAFAPGEWTWFRQVHGSTVVCVTEPGGGSGADADAGVTDVVGAVLAVQTADCVPVVMSADGAFAVVHAGWRGVVEGVIPAATAALRSRASGDITAFVGPHIRASRYAFGARDLDAVAAVAGEGVRSITHDGEPALDMTAAVRSVLAGERVGIVEMLDADTADSGWFSHRVRGDRERQVTVAWLETVAASEEGHP